MIDILFFKVWRNIFLNKIIFHHLKLYNYINNYLNDFNSIKSILEFRENFEPKGYLKSITLNISDILNGNGIYDDHSQVFDGEIQFDSFLPKDITTLTIRYRRDTISLGLDEPRIQLKLPQLPDQITTLNIITNQMEYYQNIDTKPLDISEWPLSPTYLRGKTNLKKLHFKKIPYIDYRKTDPLYNSSLKKTTTIRVGQIPMGIIDLRLPDNFNGNLEIGCIPSTVLKLKFGRAYDKPLDHNHLPNGLLELVYHGNHSIPLNCLPETLETLKLGTYFNSPIQIGSLPKSLKFLKFGKSFNQPLTDIGCFPLNENLNTLILGKNWDSILSNGVLPSSTLTHLNLGKARDFRLKQTIYTSTINILFGSKFRYSDESLIQCNQLKTLIINNFDKQLLPNSLPNSIVTIKFKNFNNANKPIQSFSLPSELEYIDFGNKFNQKILPNCLPFKKLKAIKFGKSFNQPLEKDVIPSTVNFITFKNSKFNKSPIIICNGNGDDDDDSGGSNNLSDSGSGSGENKSTKITTKKPTVKLKVRMYSSDHLSIDFKNCLNSIDCKFLSNQDESNLNSTTFPNSLTSLTIRDEFRKPINYNGFLKDKIKLTYLDIYEPLEKIELPLLNDNKASTSTTTTTTTTNSTSTSTLNNTIIINNNIKTLTLYRGLEIGKTKLQPTTPPLLIFPSVEILIIKASYLIINENQFPNLKEIHSKNHRFINSISNPSKFFEILKYPIKNKSQELDERISTILF
ncbi:hypothetical protein ACTFIU_004529 [Dictyostelium citrinum]